MPMLNRDGVKLFYDEAGRGGQPMVFVHGWTCDHTHFAPQFERFGTDRRVVAVDLKGHGQSDKPQTGPESSYDISGFADDVAWMCHELDLERPVIVGHSMGGIIALEVAAHHDIASAIVMVDAAPILAAPEVIASVNAFISEMKGPSHEAARRGFIEFLLFIDTDDPVLRAEIIEAMMAAPLHVAIACMEGLQRWDASAAVAACSVPALHIGAANPINDNAVLRGLNPLIQGGQTVGAGHFNQLMVPDQVNPMIERFLKNVTLPA